MATNHAERAFRAWPILTRVAKQADPTITYGAIAAELGIHHRVVRYVLSEIQDWCMDEKKPPLTIVVVGAGDGLPGPGFIAWDVDDLPSGMAEVTSYPWEQLTNPFTFASTGLTEEDLAKDLSTHPEKAAEIYARVKVRGAAQRIFRRALLHAYDSQCAICGMSFEDALQAAHLIPWSAASHEQRMAPSNGLLLCANHHRLLDNGLITISPTFVITYYDPEGKDGDYSEADLDVAVRRHGSKAILPKDKRLWPDALALAHHHEEWDWEF